MKVAFLGLGVMGMAIARRLQAAGVALRVWNRSADKCRPLIDAGAIGCATPAEAAAGAEIVFLCLIDGAAVEQTVFSRDGISSAACPATVIVDHSSIAPDEARKLAARLAERCGAGWLDAPVSGGVPAAEQGALTVMAGGARESYERVLPLLRHYARNINLMGPVGAGQITKLCNQILVANTIASISEALRLAVRGGIDAAQLPQALQGGWADSTLLPLIAPRMLNGVDKPLGASSTMLKDLGNVHRFAAEHDVPLPLTAVTEQLFRVLDFQSRGHLEPSELLRLFDRG
ncbi:MAG: NAD(P)-dependent oxidoreductase [Burkholderiaceae bacterium]